MSIVDQVSKKLSEIEEKKELMKMAKDLAFKLIKIDPDPLEKADLEMVFTMLYDAKLRGDIEVTAISEKEVKKKLYVKADEGYQKLIDGLDKEVKKEKEKCESES
jgi:hypothetical protein